MLTTAKTLKGFRLDGLDGGFGSIESFYFDDKYWAVRYLVADTGGWLGGTQVLVSPLARLQVDLEKRSVSVGLTRAQMEKCPPLGSHLPVSQQYEKDYFGYYGFPEYWAGPFLWGAHPYLHPQDPTRRPPAGSKAAWDPHLRSTAAVTGYHVQASDGAIGHVDDFIIDDDTWAIRYLLVDTRNWWPGRKVLVSPRWIEGVSWPDSTVTLRLTRELVFRSPAYSEQALLTRDYEDDLHRHYNDKGYWVAERDARRQFEASLQ